MSSATNDVTLIQPAPVERDVDGWWSHPGIPDFGEDANAYRSWIDAQGLDIKYTMLEDEPDDHPAYQSYFEDDTPNVAGWNVEPPKGDGWFTLSIHDTDDGPVWVWARRWIVVPA
jgi:hypothetical protein